MAIISAHVPYSRLPATIRFLIYLLRFYFYKISCKGVYFMYLVYFSISHKRRITRKSRGNRKGDRSDHNPTDPATSFLKVQEPSIYSLHRYLKLTRVHSASQ